MNNPATWLPFEFERNDKGGTTWVDRGRSVPAQVQSTGPSLPVQRLFDARTSDRLLP